MGMVIAQESTTQYQPSKDFNNVVDRREQGSIKQQKQEPYKKSKRKNDNKADNDGLSIPKRKVVEQPSKHDVLCGRGNIYSSWPGNERFQAIIRQNLYTYETAKGRQAKVRVVDDVLKQIRSVGSRIIKIDDTAKAWYELSDVESHQKVGHCLRDQLRTYKNRQKKLQLKLKKQKHYYGEDIGSEMKSSTSIHGGGVPQLPKLSLSMFNPLRNHHQQVRPLPRQNRQEPQKQTNQVQWPPSQQQIPQIHNNINIDDMNIENDADLANFLCEESVVGGGGQQQHHQQRQQDHVAVTTTNSTGAGGDIKKLGEELRQQRRKLSSLLGWKNNKMNFSPFSKSDNNIFMPLNRTSIATTDTVSSSTASGHPHHQQNQQKCSTISDDRGDGGNGKLLKRRRSSSMILFDEDFPESNLSFTPSTFFSRSNRGASATMSGRGRNEQHSQTEDEILKISERIFNI